LGLAGVQRGLTGGAGRCITQGISPGEQPPMNETLPAAALPTAQQSPTPDRSAPASSAMKAVALYDPYGWMAKIGLIVPSTNTVNEYEWYRMAPKGVSIHTARALLLGPASQSSYDLMAEATRKAGEELATAECDIVAYGCTSGSFMCSREEITGNLARLAGCKATTTSDSVLAALRALGVKRISMGTPYVDFVNQGELKFLRDEGFDVVGWHGMGLGETQAERRGINRVPPQSIFRLARLIDRPEAEAIFLSCTALPTIELIAELEAELGKPVVTSNQATFWNVLRMLKLNVKVPGFGRLLEQH
jgi:arylmalonate decarboxylase